MLLLKVRLFSTFIFGIYNKIFSLICFAIKVVFHFHCHKQFLSNLYKRKVRNKYITLSRITNWAAIMGSKCMLSNFFSLYKLYAAVRMNLIFILLWYSLTQVFGCHKMVKKTNTHLWRSEIAQTRLHGTSIGLTPRCSNLTSIDSWCKSEWAQWLTNRRRIRWNVHKHQCLGVST